MADALRHGVIGCKGVGVTHGDATEAADGIELVACADLVEANAREFAADRDLDGWYTDHVEMISDADLDSVSVCTPSGTHRDVAVPALEAGAHVLCEKPLDVYADRIDEMIRTADETGQTLAGVFQRRTNHAHQVAHDAARAGELGDLVMGDTQVKWYRSQGYYDADDWRGTRAMDGGCLMNQGIHRVDLLQWLMGGVETVHATMDTLYRDVEMETTAAVALEFENGAVGTIEVTTLAPHSASGTEIDGTEGAYRDAALHFGDRTVEVDPEGGDLSYGHTGVVQDFADAIREGREPMVPAREARKAVDVILAAYESAERGEAVDVDSIGGA